MQPEWRPTASPESLRARARMLTRCRKFFAAREVLEVETPLMSRAASTDPNLDSFRVATRGHAMYLNTSPEFAMKRLLAAGSGDVFQICKAFREGESGTLHNPEFTLLEWYRENFKMTALMQEVAQLLGELLSAPSLADRALFISYQQLFAENLQIDPIKSSAEELLSCLRKQGVAAPEGESDRDVLLDLIMSTVILPDLDPARLCFISDYPISQAALSRAHPDNPLLARRFEVVLGGMELANGFEELTDAEEQRRRFIEDGKRRAARGAPPVPVDEHLLAALEAGLGECAGVALGLDRVLMLVQGVSHIDGVLCFPVARA